MSHKLSKHPARWLWALLVLPWLCGAEPLVIGHRGASGYLPEHTLAAYQLAMEMGADFVEPDLVMTRDGHLIARHDIYLSTTTDIADHPEFADRKKTFEGHEDWFAEDFTLAEIRTLRARQAFPGRDKGEDGKHLIPAFDEVIALVQAFEKSTGRKVGIYPETKHPEHHAVIGLDFVPPLLKALDGSGFGADRVFIQSFEPNILRRLRPLTRFPLIQLVEPLSRDQHEIPNIPLTEIAAFADGVGASKYLLVRRDGSATGFIPEAHQLGLKVHIWTLRADQVLSPPFDSFNAELDWYLHQGIDGFFTDFPDLGVERVKALD
ncbi:MAG: glycerophosphodiester phosphodiesterase [Pseudomonadales bacterium]|nr:glycerophosphodiester phosphodiesterase [Pseudomonadales bacterium]